MKKTNKLWLRALGALALTLCLFLGVRAFEKEVVQETTKTSTVFHYDSEDVSAGAFADINNWKEGPTPSTKPCGGLKNKPCEKVALDEEDLADMLSGKSNEDILGDASFTFRQ